MAIVFDSDAGTITGLSVGGLPDGTVDAGTLANNAVVTGKIADGTIANADINDLAASKLTGALPAISGAALTGITEPPRKNFIINGGFTVNQRAAYTSATAVGAGAKTYVSDRWAVYIESIACTYNWYDATIDSVKRRAGKVISTGTGSSKYFHVTQQPEYESWMEGKTITISGWVRTNLAGQKIRICDGVGCYLIGSTIASDGNWAYYSAQHTLPADVSSYAAFQVHPAFGTGNFTTSTYLEWAEFKVEFGSTATAYEHRSYGEELALCQRYYEVITGGIGMGIVKSSTAADCSFQPKVNKRAAPTISFSGTFYANDGSAQQSATLTSTGGTKDGLIVVVAFSSLNTGRACMLYTPSVDHKLTVDAEF